MKLDEFKPLPCPRCGIEGIHGCLGKPIQPMNEEKAKELDKVLSDIFEKKDK